MRSLTATVTSLEVDLYSLPITSEDFQVTYDDDSLGQENVADTITSTPDLASLDDSASSEEDIESEEKLVNDSMTVAQEVEMHLGSNNAQV